MIETLLLTWYNKLKDSSMKKQHLLRENRRDFQNNPTL